MAQKTIKYGQITNSRKGYTIDVFGSSDAIWMDIENDTSMSPHLGKEQALNLADMLVLFLGSNNDEWTTDDEKRAKIIVGILNKRLDTTIKFEKDRAKEKLEIITQMKAYHKSMLEQGETARASEVKACILAAFQEK